MGKSSKEVTVGFRYHMGIQIVGCHGPVDSFNRLIVGEREAWTGSVTDNATIHVNKPELFGGDEREGGVVGDIDVMMGGPTQPRNTYLAAQQGPKCPAYRGLFSLVFKQFLWSSGNPYFKSPWVEVTRCLKGWENDTPWHPEIAMINGKDMNPAHIIYQCFTDSSWGMGYSASDIDDAEWLAAAQQLYNEQFGLSLMWDQQSDIESFVQQIVNHINGAIGVNLSTGKFRLKLIRDDYNINDLLELNVDNIIEMKSFQRAAYGDSANELVISYVDRDQNAATVAVQDLASIQAQGAVISSTQSYPGIRDASLASRVGLRDLRTLSSPLAKTVLVTNRVLWDKDKGDVVKLNWPIMGINGAAFRIIDIDKGTLLDGSITVTLVEDIFGLPANSYSAQPISQWVDTVVPPIAVSASRVVEASYWDVVHTMSLADQRELQEGYGFGLFMASRGAVRSTLNYRIVASPNNVDYTDVGVGHFNPTGNLVDAISPVAETLTLTGAYDLDNVTLSTDGGYAYIENECVSILSADPLTGVVTIKRGILDTVPASHVAGSKMFFVKQGTGYDTTERVSGETVYYKPLPSTGSGTLPLNDAIAKTLVLANRASRPYPPGNFRVDGLLYPVTVAGPTFTVSWSHRDRSAQTVDFVDYSTGNIGPEIGTTYRLRVWNGLTLLRTYDLSGATVAWSYPSDDDAADGSLATLTVTVNSVRDGIESLYSQGHTFQRLVASGSVGIDGKPAAPILSAGSQNFAINLTWLFGDARTNIEKVELRVSDDPDFNHSTTLQYVNYPGIDYLHELGTALTYKWYWAQVTDTGGQLSPWSNMVSGRSTASASSPTQMLADINGILSGGSSTTALEIVPSNFAVVAPDGNKTPFAVVDVGGGVYKTLINSDVLIGGNVDIANLTTGSLPADVVLRLGGGVIEMDGAGEIRVHKDMSPNADFVRLSSGEIRFLRYIAGAYQTYNYLSRLETGIANSGDLVTIPGYWKAQPRIIVSPAILSLYKAAYVNQDQAIACEALNLVETSPGSGQWQFNATATLNLAAASGGSALNITSGVISSNTYTTATQTTPANCSTITPSLTLTSVRGNGASLNYRRNVRWRVEYFNVTWVVGSWNTISMGDQTGPVTSAIQFTFPSATTWQWRIAYEAMDTDGTTFGTTSYTYSQTTVNAPNISPASFTTVASGAAGAAVYPAFGAATGSGEIYQITYNATPQVIAHIASGTGSTFSVSLASGYSSGVHRTVNNVNWNHTDSGGAVIASGKVGSNMSLGTSDTTWSGGAQSQTVSGSNLTFNTKYWALATRAHIYGVNVSVKLNLTSISATIYRRTPVANSTTPANTFALDSYTYALTTAQVLATGSINWMAVGE